MARSVAKVQKAALGQQNNPAARWHFDHVHLVLDVGPLVVFQAGHLNFIVEMADVADDRHVLHFAHMLDTNDILVACGGDENVGTSNLFFQQDNFETIHRGLKRADWVNFGHFHTCTGAAQRRSRAFAHIAIATNDGNFTGHHRVRRATDAIYQRFLTAIFVVEFRLGHRVVHVDRRKRQLAIALQFIKTVNTGCGFFGHALDRIACFREPARAFRHALGDLRFDHGFFFRRWYRNDVFPGFGTGTQQHVQCRIAAIIQDHVRAIGEHEALVQIVPMLFQRLAFDRKYRNAGLCDCSGGVILCREDVA